MRITDKFIFIHLPKTGGTWMRSVLLRAHLNMFLSGSPLGKIINIIIKIFPATRQRMEKLIYPLVTSEYSHSPLQDFTLASFGQSPYERKKISRLLLKIASFTKLIPPSKPLVMFLVHSRRSQLPESLVNLPILGCINNPFRWHISRFNYYKNRRPNNIHAAEICHKVGDFNNFSRYCDKQMMETQAIYYKSYTAAMAANSGIDKYQYPVDVFSDVFPDEFSWLAKSSAATQAPQHIGLQSFLFLWFFFRNPLEVMNFSDKEYLEYFSSGEYKKELNNISFLQTANLNQDTYDFLLQKGYPPRDINFVKEMSPLNVSTKGAYDGYYSNNELVDRIYKLERAMFIMFPQHEEAYQQHRL